MRSEDFYSGEPVSSGSPQTFSDNSTNDAANMANFGAYAYDPNYRMQNQFINPGGYGYSANNVPPQYYYQQNNPYMYNNGFGGYMNQPVNNPYNGMYNPVGIGAPLSPYGNVQPTYGMYGSANPAIYYQQQMQAQQRPSIVHINGVGYSGQYMPPADFEKRISDLEQKYYAQSIRQEAIAEVNSELNRNVYGYSYNSGMNYYGMPFYGSSYNTQADLELRREVEKLQQEARKNRLEFDMKISRLAHNFCGDGISDEQIRERYMGKDVTIPQNSFISSPEDYWEIGRFYNCEPFNNAQMYRDHFNKVREEFNKIIPADSNLKDTFANMGILDAQYKLEEEMHRRKDGGNLYNNSDNSYKRLIRKKAKERYCREKGIVLNDDTGLPNNIPTAYSSLKAKQDFVNNSSLKDSCTINPDGSLNVSIKLPCNVGSHSGQLYTVNENESSYDEKRQRFGQFLDSIPGNIYLDQKKAEKLGGYNYE